MKKMELFEIIKLLLSGTLIDLNERFSDAKGIVKLRKITELLQSFSYFTVIIISLIKKVSQLRRRKYQVFIPLRPKNVDFYGR